MVSTCWSSTPALSLWRIPVLTSPSPLPPCRRVAEITKATPTHLYVRFVDNNHDLSLALHRGSARLTRPFTRSERSAASTASATASASHSPRSSHQNGRLHISPTLAAVGGSPSPLTPWSPSTVDYSITGSCIIHQPAPPLLSPSSPGAMVVVPMSKDNSCLYHSIAYVCDGKKTRKGLHVMQQRLRAHDLVTADSETYSAVVLGCEPALYVSKLLNLSTWGGGIELGLFSSLYECEIFAFDFTQPTVYRFGDNNRYDKRVFLVYSGSHYEVLAYDEAAAVQEFFSSKDDEALRRAQAVVEAMFITRRDSRAGGAAGQPQQVVWAGQGLYELKAKARSLYQRYLSPRGRQRPPLPQSAPAASSASLQQPSPKQAGPVIHTRASISSISVPTPLSSHARRSSFTFGLSPARQQRALPAFSPPALASAGALSPLSPVNSQVLLHDEEEAGAVQEEGEEGQAGGVRLPAVRRPHLLQVDSGDSRPDRSASGSGSLSAEQPGLRRVAAEGQQGEPGDEEEEEEKQWR